MLLEKIVPEHGVMEDYEVEYQFPGIGKRTMMLNARKVFYEGNPQATLLLGIEDVTERRGSNAASVVAGYSIASEMARRSDNGLGRASIPKSHIPVLWVSSAREQRLSCLYRDGRVARATQLAVAKDVVEPNLHLPRPGHTDCVGAFNANDFDLPTTIARIIVVQNLSRFEHDASLPLWVGAKLSCPAKAGHSILINEPVDRRVKRAILYRFPHFDFGESGRSRRKAKRPGVQFNFQNDAHPASSNRTEPTSGGGKAHAFSRCVVHAQARPVPSMRRRDRSCRD
jgi:hypothetical protein